LFKNEEVSPFSKKMTSKNIDFSKKNSDKKMDGLLLENTKKTLKDFVHEISER